jgi:hypothetical protein
MTGCFTVVMRFHRSRVNTYSETQGRQHLEQQFGILLHPGILRGAYLSFLILGLLVVAQSAERAA